MRVSTRHCAAIALLALLAVAGVWPAWLAPERTDPCAAPDLLRVTGLIPGTPPTPQETSRLSADVIQWTGGDLRRDGFTFRIVRSYDVVRHAERPLSYVPGIGEAEDLALEWREAPGGPLPVHVVTTGGVGVFQVVGYLFLLGNEPVRSPLLARLAGVLDALRSGRKPFTLLLAVGPATRDTETETRERVIEWVEDAWAHYRLACFRAPSEASETDPP